MGLSRLCVGQCFGHEAILNLVDRGLNRKPWTCGVTIAADTACEVLAFTEEDLESKLALIKGPTTEQLRWFRTHHDVENEVRMAGVGWGGVVWGLAAHAFLAHTTTGAGSVGDARAATRLGA